MSFLCKLFSIPSSYNLTVPGSPIPMAHKSNGGINGDKFILSQKSVLSPPILNLKGVRAVLNLK
jgi:hypothetical protein